MPTKMEVSAKVREIVVENLGVDASEVTPDAHLADDLGADSLDAVELGLSFEEAFDIELPDEDLERLRTIQDVEDYILKQVTITA